MGVYVRNLIIVPKKCFSCPPESMTNIHIDGLIIRLRRTLRRIPPKASLHEHRIFESDTEFSRQIDPRFDRDHISRT